MNNHHVMNTFNKFNNTQLHHNNYLIGFIPIYFICDANQIVTARYFRVL